MKKLLICLCGPPGSGKSLISNVGKKYSFPILSMGDYVRREAKRRYGVINSENVRELMIKLRQERGKEAVAELMINDLKSCKSNIVIIDGVRCIEEIQLFRKHGFTPIVIYVYASTKTRYLRIINRGRQDDISDITAFLKRENNEVKVGVKELIKIADYILVNENCSKEEIMDTFDSVIKEIIKIHGYSL